MSKTVLKYRTFDNLLDEVATDFHVYNLEGMIEPAQLFKVVLRINKELGLKINQVKETIIDIDHRKGRLPLDFYVANFALVCGKHSITLPVLSGRHTENIDITVPDGAISQITQVTSDCPDGNCAQFKVVETVNFETREYHEFYKLNLKSGPLVDRECENIRHQSKYTGELVDNHLRTNLECGRIYLSYIGNMVDDDNNLLCLDHDIINEYYEYALKLRILENLYMNGEDVVQKMSFIEEKRLKQARNNALSIANTPDFAELEQAYKMNRKAMHARYYRMFYSI